MSERKPGDRDPDFDNRQEGGPASRGERVREMGYGRGYGRDFGGGRGQGFEGSWAQGYGGSTGASDYREGGMAGADYPSVGGRDEEAGGGGRSWWDVQAERGGPHAGKGPRGWTRSDLRVYEEVCERLLQDRLLDARDVEVRVDNGVVILSGEVPGASDAAHAEMLARQAPGVTGVRNELRYRPGRRAIDRQGAPNERDHYEGRWGRWVPPFIP